MFQPQQPYGIGGAIMPQPQGWTPNMQPASPQDQWQMTLQKLQAMQPKKEQGGGGLGDIIKLAATVASFF